MAFLNKCIVKNNSVLQMFEWISKSIKLSYIFISIPYIVGFRLRKEEHTTKIKDNFLIHFYRILDQAKALCIQRNKLVVAIRKKNNCYLSNIVSSSVLSVFKKLFSTNIVYHSRSVRQFVGFLYSYHVSKRET